jgi:hypothetical protein
MPPFIDGTARRRHISRRRARLFLFFNSNTLRIYGNFLPTQNGGNVNLYPLLAASHCHRQTSGKGGTACRGFAGAAGDAKGRLRKIHAKSVHRRTL